MNRDRVSPSGKRSGDFRSRIGGEQELTGASLGCLGFPALRLENEKPLPFSAIRLCSGDRDE